MKTTIGFIGGGRITKIFLEGFKNKNVEFESVKVYDPNNETLDALASDFPAVKKAGTPEEAAQAKVVVIAVHPPVVMETLEKIAGVVNDETFVVSLAPKITIEKIASKVKTANIVRMIPNATSYINEGYNPLAFHPAMLKKEKKQIKKLFKPLGKTFETEEHKLEGYAIISGMLPTYFWFQWQELETIGEKTGLSKEEAAKIIRTTLKNAIKLYYKSGLTPEEVMDLIPVKPIGENEEEIKNTLNSKLLGLFEKIKP
ncbi:pyrroline-5-carboxylate reductase [Tangfeifania diversioriginum]|uniref:Pyrroline-5-carboxylate reductase n=1 Tax=Tangfeifania diversioriginum TaxID=1168035 RepID=A0A1M6C8N1_9BACT|nr:NAD(P)-binding domain-containing protein [Tangfeifania diversioriginum]SHI57098.1 pyrroline-5-carboxylate reductase [Tangfeifania diversioriginum]